MNHKFFIFFFSLIYLSHNSLANSELELADSLFSNKKYTEAYDQYELIYQNGKATPAMLQKMAFIQEGLENYVGALFFLNQYYNLTANKKVLNKMRSIAEEQNLSGYEYSDIEFFQNYLFKYNNQFVLGLGALSILLVAYIYRRKKTGMPIGFAAAFQVLVVVFLTLISNQFFVKDMGIVSADQSILMRGPSAGAEPVEVITKGHRVVILDQQSAWIKILWNDEEVYIRDKKIVLI